MLDGWIDDGDGVFWDKNTNSPEEFAQNYAGKPGHSYVSDSDNPNAYTLQNGDGKLVMNRWEEYPIENGISGPSMELEFIPSDNNSNSSFPPSF